MQKKIYVVGMFDDDTAAKVQSAVSAVAGVTNCVANCEKSQVLVDYDDVDVWTLRKEYPVSQKLVRKKVVTDKKIYPYKTVKHKYYFEIPTIENLTLGELK